MIQKRGQIFPPSFKLSINQTLRSVFETKVSDRLPSAFKSIRIIIAKTLTRHERLRSIRFNRYFSFQSIPYQFLSRPFIYLYSRGMKRLKISSPFQPAPVQSYLALDPLLRNLLPQLSYFFFMASTTRAVNRTSFERGLNAFKFIDIIGEGE